MNNILTTSIRAATVFMAGAIAIANEPAPSDPAFRGTLEVAENQITVTTDTNGNREVRKIALGDGRGILNLHTTTTQSGDDTFVFLGVATDELSPEQVALLPLETGTGLMVRGVMKDSPAEKA